MKVIFFDLRIIKGKKGIDGAVIARLASLAKGAGYCLMGYCHGDISSLVKDVQKAFMMRGVNDFDYIKVLEECAISRTLREYIGSHEVSRYVVLTHIGVADVNAYIVDDEKMLTDKDVKKLRRLLV